jgi:hypothetical protein
MSMTERLRTAALEVWSHVPTRAALAVAFAAGLVVGCVAG